eukprot:CAMPEP_0172393360 /NCGR_PEP_ID=MMETSP1061-20121228/9237_1 /TAXON_ID=37318 /ORGANISM="Pseudo-nitzschia pungens, Strain cf. pungens" /LENGTH=506 /DNA_ID=CAMNT_0013124399 /DNA_START=369 /DNA_END=1886 /DNA_ORIENTATION=-
MVSTVDERPQHEDLLMMVNSQFEAMKILDGKAESESAGSSKDKDRPNSKNSLSVEKSNSARASNCDSSKKMKTFFGGLHEWASRANGPKLKIDVGTLISKEMLQYNLEERNALYEEIHGVRTICPDESSDMIKNALMELEEALLGLPDKKKAAYKQSQEYPTTYVNGRCFQVRFLRAELFDAKKAAIRIVEFLETGLDFFGPEVLQRPPRLSDFSRKELKVFNIGRIQLLPYRDRSGRRVIVGIPAHDHLRQEAKTRAKIHFYLWWLASDSVESQKRGMVFVTIHNPAIADSTTEDYSNGHANKKMNENYTPEQQQEISGLPSMQFAKFSIYRRNCLPMRMSAFHLCTPDSPFYSVVRSFTTAVLGGDRCRIKVHVGNDIENRYQLNGYGIPPDQLPITETGKIKLTFFKKWVQFRRNLEDPYHEVNWKKESFVECPGLADVVFRPSQSTMCHPGNVTFRSLVEARHTAHSTASTREQKANLNYEVMKEIKKLGGRFLAWNSIGCW